MHGTKQGDSGNFTTLRFVKFRNDVREVLFVYRDQSRGVADQANRPYTDKTVLKFVNLLNYSTLCLER